MQILYMSGYTGDVLRDRGVQTDHLIMKPFTPDELADAVAALCRGTAP
jgi:two-component SAPR family response regulator